MKIDAVTSNAYAGMRPPAASADRPGAASFSAALNTAMDKSSSSSKQVDFSSMSSQGLRDWTNAQIRNGDMTLDESRPFMAMSMNIPVHGESANSVPAGSDTTRFDYTQKVRDGIVRARTDDDQKLLKMLESALQIMQKNQGKTSSIDTRA